jgi:hypothetical protein
MPATLADTRDGAVWRGRRRPRNSPRTPLGEPQRFGYHTHAVAEAILFGFSPKLPVSEEQRQWVNNGFRRLESLLGRRRMLEARVIEPTAEDFPDAYHRTPEALETLFSRVCTYMRVDRSAVKLEVFPDETEELRQMLPSWSGRGGKGAAGLYLHALQQGHGSENPETGMVVAIRSTMLKDPMSLVATVAHELGHVILLGGGLMSNTAEDHEPMTDLLTVFLGLGIFTANSAARFKQFQDDRKVGWSVQRLGYLPERVFGYALAKFASERGENKPQWARHLSPNVRSDFKNSMRWLAENQNYVYMAKPIG